MVAAFFPGDSFALVTGATSRTPPKPDPAGALGIAKRLGVAPDACLFLGDMAVDMNTARAAGMFPVGALWGYQSAAALLDAGAAALVRTPADLTTLIR
jgi:phosphoglycolate phosphatase